MPVTDANRALIARQAEILRALSVTVVEVAGHESRAARQDINSTPYFFGIHHTGSDGTPLSTIRLGRSDLPGPLANWYLPRGEGRTVYLIADGYTNHGGGADQAPLTEVKDGDVDRLGTIRPGADDPGVYANRWSHAVEVAAAGPFTADQYQTTLALAASFALAIGANRDPDGDGRWMPVLGHKEWTARKVDPVFDMAKFRAEAQQLAEQYLTGGVTAPPPTPPEEPVPTGTPPRLTVDGQFGPATTRALQWSLGRPQTGTYGEGTRKALQAWLGVTVDGIIGPKTAGALQRWLDVPDDGLIGPISIRRWQEWLNTLIAADAKRPATSQAADDPFRFGAANLQGYNGRHDAVAQAAAVRQLLAASGLALSETTRAKRRAIEAAHGPTWWVFPHPGGTVAAALDLAKWQPPVPADVRTVSFGTAYGHGAILLPTARYANGRPMQITAVHVRPAAVASKEDKAADLARAAGMSAVGAAILAGDFAQRAGTRLGALGWVQVSPDADSMDRDGAQRVDAVFARGRIQLRHRRLVDPGSWSDHHWPLSQLTSLGSPLTTT